MRFRYGLSIEPVFLPRKPSTVCVSQRSWGEKRNENLGCCAAKLDAKGRHAVMCPVGGKTIRRHDTIVHRLAELLKKFVISCSTEVYIFELEQVCPETGEWTEAKLDLEVVTREGRYLLDVSVLHPFQNGRKGVQRHVKLSEREKRKYERYPTHKDGQRVIDATLVPIILNTFGAVGEKATEFLFAVAGSEANRIIDEISLLAVYLSAEMILSSHAPSNLANLLPIVQADGQKEKPDDAEQPQAAREEDETEKDERGFLRPELRGETEGNKVECLGCKRLTTAARWNWNRHVELKHLSQPAQQHAAQQSIRPVERAAHPAAQSAARPAEPAKQQAARTVERATHPPCVQNSKVSRGGEGDPASAEMSAFAPDPPAPQISKMSRDARKDPASAEISAIAPHPPAPQISKMSRGRKEDLAHPASEPVEPAPQLAARPTRKRPRLTTQQRAAQQDHQSFQDKSTVGEAGVPFSIAPGNNVKLPKSAPKEQGTFGLANDRSVPSRNPVSKEPQAGMRPNVDSLISSPVNAKKYANDVFPFSSKNANITK